MVFSALGRVNEIPGIGLERRVTGEHRGRTASGALTFPPIPWINRTVYLNGLNWNHRQRAVGDCLGPG